MGFFCTDDEALARLIDYLFAFAVAMFDRFPLDSMIEFHRKEIL